MPAYCAPSHAFYDGLGVLGDFKNVIVKADDKGNMVFPPISMSFHILYYALQLRHQY
jgi:hypothetical protein